MALAVVMAACSKAPPHRPLPAPAPAASAPAATAPAAAAATDAELARRLRAAAVPVRSLDPADRDFSDLEPLRAILDDVRIVQLGEQTHGDGATFAAKVRLIQFLHQELGFTVVAFESGLYDCARAWQSIAAGGDPVAAARAAIFPLWSESAQVQPLWHYLGQAAKGDRPLELAGFDSQFTGSYSARHLTAELGQLTGDPAAAERLGPVISGAETTADERDRIRDAITTLERKVKGPDAAFWKQLLRSTRAQAEAQWKEADAGLVAMMSAASNNPRDAQMADNLIWLAKEKYPGRKIIVWGATMHLIRNAPTLEGPGLIVGTTRPYDGLVNMGQLVADELGDAVYTIGFLAHEGEWKWAGGAGFSGTIEPAPDGSFEALFNEAGLELALLDLRANPALWSAPRLARPLGYADMTGDWTQIVDAFFFTKTMTPSQTAP